ncbi:hypothetical protein FRC02_000901, partial [Tulasnella sp. 418]
WSSTRQRSRISTRSSAGDPLVLSFHVESAYDTRSALIELDSRSFINIRSLDYDLPMLKSRISCTTSHVLEGRSWQPTTFHLTSTHLTRQFEKPKSSSFSVFFHTPVIHAVIHARACTHPPTWPVFDGPGSSRHCTHRVGLRQNARAPSVAQERYPSFTKPRSPPDV